MSDALERVPMGKVGRTLGRLIAANVGMAEKLPLILGDPHMTPMRLCRVLDEIREDLAYIDERLVEAQAAVRQTWEVAAWETSEADMTAGVEKDTNSSTPAV